MNIDDIFSSIPPTSKRKAADELPTPAPKASKLVEDDGHVSGTEDDRFFDDGLCEKDRNVLDFVDQAADDLDQIEDFGLAALKKIIARVHRSYDLNMEMRMKFPNDPTKFIQSEVDLDADIRSLSILATDPSLYVDAVQLNLPSSLIHLLAHENVDITLSAIEVLTELLDDSVINPEVSFDANILDGIHSFVDSLLDLDLLTILGNAIRDEASLSLDQGTESIIKFLTLLDALLSVDPSMPTRLAKTDIIPILLDFVRPLTYSPLSAYATELLAVITHNSISAQIVLMIDHGGMDVLLKSIAKYRKRDPVDEEETEYLANSFDIVCLSLSVPKIQSLFRELEGFELMVMLVNSRRLSRIRAIRAINLATLPLVKQDSPGSEMEAIRNAFYFISVQGLSCIFPLFMQHDHRKLQRKYPNFFSPISDEEHTVSVLVNLFRCLHLAISSSHQEFQSDVPIVSNRVLKKFKEDNRAKLVHLAIRFAWYWNVVGNASVNKEMYLSRLDQGLYTLTQLSVLMCYIIHYSAECADCITGALLPASGNSLSDLHSVVCEYLEHADSSIVSELTPIVKKLALQD